MFLALNYVRKKYTTPLKRNLKNFPLHFLWVISLRSFSLAKECFNFFRMDLSAARIVLKCLLLSCLALFSSRSINSEKKLSSSVGCVNYDFCMIFYDFSSLLFPCNENFSLMSNGIFSLPNTQLEIFLFLIIVSKKNVHIIIYTWNSAPLAKYTGLKIIEMSYTDLNFFFLIQGVYAKSTSIYSCLSILIKVVDQLRKLVFFFALSGGCAAFLPY